MANEKKSRKTTVSTVSDDSDDSTVVVLLLFASLLAGGKWNHFRTTGTLVYDGRCLRVFAVLSCFVSVH